jgi:hypothetical protein
LDEGSAGGTTLSGSSQAGLIIKNAHVAIWFRFLKTENNVFFYTLPSFPTMPIFVRETHAVTPFLIK